jgi:hypothetical protein
MLTQKTESTGQERVPDVLQADEHAVMVVLGQRRHALERTGQQCGLHGGELERIVDDKQARTPSRTWTARHG